MKKVTNAKSLYAFLLTGVLLTACSNDDSVTEQQNALEAGKTYYMSVEATKGSDEDASRATRALTISGGKLYASWSKDYDCVYLRDHDTNLRFKSLLKPSNDGHIAWLNGTVTPTATIHQFPIDVKLIFPRKDWSYAGQLGTIENIAARFDYSIADARIDEIEANSVTSSLSATFGPQQAIVKFTLLNKDNNNAELNASSLRISASGLKTGETETGDITITPTDATNVIYAALRGISGAKVTLTATVDNDTYIYNKANVTFTHGSYYPITVKMHKVTYPVNLTDVNTDDYIGSVVGTDGRVYAKASDVPEGHSAVAMIAYVGSQSNCTHGLAVALTDESEKMNQSNANTAASTTKNSNTRVENGTWRLPSKLDLENMFIGCGGTGDSDCSAFNSKLATVGSALLSTYQYWTSSPNYKYLSVNNGGATFLSDQLDGLSPYYVRAVLFF